MINGIARAISSSYHKVIKMLKTIVETILGREYRHFASPLSEGLVRLPYSGEYFNPGYVSRDTLGMREAHGYDIGGTLASASDRDAVIRRLTRREDIRSDLFNNPDFTRQVSQFQEEGIRSGQITVAALEGVVSQLDGEKAKGHDTVLITVGTYQMARSFIHGAGLEDYVSALVTSEEAGTGNMKTKEMFLQAYKALMAKGAVLVDYCDDVAAEAIAAVRASQEIERTYGRGFQVYLVMREAADSQVGRTPQGYTVIRNISEKGQYDYQESAALTFTTS